MTLVLSITAISGFTYLVYLLIFHFGLNKGQADLDYFKKTVSVVVAARNEEKNIGNLLTGLVNQSYSQKLYEITVVNDRSTDRTAEIVRQFAEKWDNVRLINIEKTPTGLSPKKYALQQAIDASNNEIILLTDADCLVTKYWIEAMASNFKPETAMVAGFSRTLLPKWHKASVVKRFEFFDFLVMFMAAAGAILSGKTFSCSNQNLAYRKSSFDEVGGFQKIKRITSGDDVNLMQLFRKQGLKIGFSLVVHSYVYTKPVNSWSELISQRIRWASNAKWQLLLNPEFFLYLLMVFLLHISIIVMLFVSLQTALALFAGKLLCEYIFLSSHFSQFEHEKRRLAFFPLWAFIQPFYMIIVALLGLFDLFKWKSAKDLATVDKEKSV